MAVIRGCKRNQRRIRITKRTQFTNDAPAARATLSCHRSRAFLDRLLQSYAPASTVLVDEFDAGGFRPTENGWIVRFIVFGPSLSESSSPYFQSDADLSVIVFGELNAGLLKGFLYFEDGREVSFHDALTQS